MTLVYLVQHGEKEPVPGDPGLTGTGREQSARTGRWLRGADPAPGRTATMSHRSG
ncbi:MAG: hypothetical protein ACRDPF_06240 [Streptosporangiaceae bacterium]